MTDPYKILGVTPSSSDEEVKAAYRELAKKYHPDNYNNSPLSDLASDKMKETNEAYDQIMDARRGAPGQSGQPGRAYSQPSSQFSDIRHLINHNRITDAEELLDGVPEASRDGEWYFLKGSVFYTRGWLDEAFHYFTQAATRNPDNPEYRAALNQMAWQRTNGANPRGGYGESPRVGACCTPCDVCNGLICADCCCECMGGDLINCC